MLHKASHLRALMNTVMNLGFYINSGEFLDQLNDYQLLKKDCAQSARTSGKGALCDKPSRTMFY
jgi:hypothetical protein